MRKLLVSQRVDVSPHGERRDGLDQRWAGFLHACGLLPIAVPNVANTTANFLELPDIAGVLLTGGNDLAMCGGDVPERDAVEHQLLETAIRRHLPVLGVCHGMQVIQAYFGHSLIAVEGHIQSRQTISIDGAPSVVNSYHRYGTRETIAPLQTWATADDGVVKAVRHDSLPVTGIMWHPERMSPWTDRDLQLFKTVFETR